MSTHKKFNFLLLIALTLCWGPSFFFIKYALKEVSLTTIATVRISLAAVLLFVIVQIQRQSLWKWRPFMKHFLCMSALSSLIPVYLLNYAETKISSSLAGILNAAQPIFAAILAHYILETERFTVKSLIGITIGFSGILFIFLPSVFGSNDTSGWGVIMMTTAAFTNALSAVYARRFLSHVPSLISAAYQFLFGMLISLPIAMIVSSEHLLHLPSFKVLMMLCALGIFGSGIAYILFYYLVKHAGATYVSSVSLLLPFVAIILGVSFLNEILYWTTYIGCILILIGLAITNSLVRLKSLKLLLERKKNNTDQ